VWNGIGKRKKHADKREIEKSKKALSEQQKEAERGGGENETK